MQPVSVEHEQGENMNLTKGLLVIAGVAVLAAAGSWRGAAGRLQARPGTATLQQTLRRCPPAGPRRGVQVAVRVFIDYRCDGHFKPGWDQPIRGAQVTAGGVVRVTGATGFASFAGLDVAPLLDVHVTLPENAASFRLLPCRCQNPIRLCAADFALSDTRLVEIAFGPERRAVPRCGAPPPVSPTPPKDPGGYITDQISQPGPGATPFHIRESVVTLFQVTGTPDPPDRPGEGTCRTMGTRPGGDWANVPTPSVATRTHSGEAAESSLSPPKNPTTVPAGSGSYGWDAPDHACYYVRVTRDSESHFSPLVGVTGDPPVDDLHFCWVSKRWGSVLADICN
jgi:hypothetical protein